MSYWLSVILNFAAIAGVMIWAGTQVLARECSATARAAIQKAMQEAQMASADARRQKLAEISKSRLMKARHRNRDMIRNAAEQEGAAEADSIQAAARGRCAKDHRPRRSRKLPPPRKPLAVNSRPTQRIWQLDWRENKFM
jgi:hypothetical protein